MKNVKKFLFSVLVLVLLLLPIKTLAATPKYKFDKEYLYKSSEKFYSGSHYNNLYSSAIAISDEYVFIQASKGVYKHDIDLKLVSTFSSLSGFKFVEDFDGDYFYNISSNSIKFIDTDLKGISTVNLKFDDNNTKTFSSYVMCDEKIYAVYRVGSYPDYEYHVAVIDKEGNIIGDNVISQTASLYKLDNEVYYIIRKNESSTYTSEIYKVKSNGNTELIKILGDVNISELYYGVQNSFVALDLKYTNNVTERYVVVYDNEFNEVKRKFLDGNIVYEDFIDFRFMVTDKYFVFAGTLPEKTLSQNPTYVIDLYDKDFNFVDGIVYQNEVIDDDNCNAPDIWSTVIDNDIYSR